MSDAANDSHSQMPLYYAGINGSHEIPNEAELIAILTPAVQACREMLHEALSAMVTDPSHVNGRFTLIIATAAMRSAIEVHRQRTSQ